ncbi:phage tail tape measure protein, partial [Streptococcus pneumoniae]
EIIKKGFDANQTIEAMPAILDAAKASGEDFNTVMNATTNILQQFGLSTQDTERVTNSLTFVANKTAAGFADMGAAMEYVGPVAKNVGMDLEETAATVGLLSNNGIAGEKAGTALRGALTRLLKPSKQN